MLRAGGTPTRRHDAKRDSNTSGKGGQLTMSVERAKASIAAAAARSFVSRLFIALATTMGATMACWLLPVPFRLSVVAGPVTFVVLHRVATCRQF